MDQKLVTNVIAIVSVIIALIAILISLSIARDEDRIKIENRLVKIENRLDQYDNKEEQIKAKIDEKDNQLKTEIKNQYNQLKSEMDKIEGRLDNLKSIQSKKNDKEVKKDNYPLTTLNMNRDQQLESIEIVSKFHIEWDEGPASKVFQVYLEGKVVKKERVKNGDLISLPKDIRGQVQVKTWWDDGTRRREEIWVYIVNAQ